MNQTMNKFARYTAEDDRIIRREWAAHVLVRDIARKLGRSAAAIRGRVFVLNLHRSHSTTSLFAWAPDHLKAQSAKLGPKAFSAACYAWRQQQRDAERAAKAAATAATIAKIDRQRGLTRNEKIKAMRDRGMTLQAIGDHYGLTRERVRQLTKRQWVKPNANAAAVGNPIQTSRITFCSGSMAGLRRRRSHAG